MNVALSPDMEKMVNDKVASGEYASAREVVGEALRLLQERDENQQRRREALRRQIAVGLEQLERGEAIPGKQVFDELRQRSSDRREQHVK
jgi:antitoxin ParD1/3/4